MKPDRKVAAGGLAGALATVVVWVIGLFGVDVPGDVGAAIATILMFAVAYIVPNQPSEA